MDVKRIFPMDVWVDVELRAGVAPWGEFDGGKKSSDLFFFPWDLSAWCEAEGSLMIISNEWPGEDVVGGGVACEMLA